MVKKSLATTSCMLCPKGKQSLPVRDTIPTMTLSTLSIDAEVMTEEIVNFQTLLYKGEQMGEKKKNTSKIA